MHSVWHLRENDWLMLLTWHLILNQSEGHNTWTESMNTKICQDSNIYSIWILSTVCHNISQHKISNWHSQSTIQSSRQWLCVWSLSPTGSVHWVIVQRAFLNINRCSSTMFAQHFAAFHRKLVHSHTAVHSCWLNNHCLLCLVSELQIPPFELGVLCLSCFITTGWYTYTDY